MIRLNPPRALGVAAIGLAAAYAAAVVWETNANIAYAIIGVAVLLALLTTVTIKGRTLSSRWRSRRRFRSRLDRRTKVQLYSTNKAGTTWDGQSASMYVAFLPKPWQISVTDIPDPVLPPAIPMNLLRSYLVQGDIVCENIDVVLMGYRRFARAPFTTVYEASYGDTGLPTSQTTAVKITVNLERSLGAVWRRNISDSVPGALGNTVKLVADRLTRALNVEGYEARLMTAPEVAWLNTSILNWTHDGLKNEKWDHLAGSMPVVVTTPAEWTGRAAEKWFSVPSDRMAAVFSLQPGRFSTEITHAQLAYAYPAADKFPEKSFFLERASGTQGDAMTEILPLAVNSHRAPAPLPLARSENYPINIPGTGLGVFLGPGLDGGRVFMNTQTGGEVLFVHAPAQFVASLAARVSAVGATVGLYVDGQAWEELCQRVNPDLMAVHPRQRRSVEIYKDLAPSEVKDATAVIVWCPKKLPLRATYSLSMDREGRGVVNTPDSNVSFRWAPTDEELAFLPGARTAASAT